LGVPGKVSEALATFSVSQNSSQALPLTMRSAATSASVLPRSFRISSEILRNSPRIETSSFLTWHSQP
jgi:hypothetical protein